MKPFFDHEKRKVYQASLSFNAWVGDLLPTIEQKAAVKDQLDRAATSIPLNIAEGNGKFSTKDRARYFDIARGSSVESSACLDVLLSRKLITEQTVIAGKRQLVEIVNMLMGLLRHLGVFDERIAEEPSAYLTLTEQEQEQE
jgi:four helix bundle protein